MTNGFTIKKAFSCRWKYAIVRAELVSKANCSRQRMRLNTALDLMMFVIS